MRINRILFGNCVTLVFHVASIVDWHNVYFNDSNWSVLNSAVVQSVSVSRDNFADENKDLKKHLIEKTAS